MNRKIKLYNDDNLNVMAGMPDESIDVICIDPPYLYLKGQKLERPFDESKFFGECKRLLTKNGFIVMFGRGTSFYRWNTILGDLGFNFKEEIIWNKSYCSSPLMAISRVHETVSIFTKGNGIINKAKVPYLEMKGACLNDIQRDINRLNTVFSNTEHFNALNKYLNKNELSFDGTYGESTTITSGRKRVNRVVSTFISIEQGLNEKSIIKEVRDHYSAIHPTQKPVRLIERLLALVIPKDRPRNQIVVADFFGGSMSCMEAVHNMGMQGIACEIDTGYFESGKARIEALQPKQEELFNEAIYAGG